jgi:hypothetical protein
MTQDGIMKMAQEIAAQYSKAERFQTWTHDYMMQRLMELVAVSAAAERERIKAANAPEIERINAHIKKLEDAVLAEREACAKVCEEYADDSRTGATCADAIRARGQA